MLDTEQWISAAAALIALFALAISLWQGVLSRRVAIAQFSPAIEIETENFENLKSIKLLNKGNGAAKITKIEFRRNHTPYDFGEFTPNVARMFSFYDDVTWRTYREIGIKPWHIMSQMTIDLVRLDVNCKGVNEGILQKWSSEIVGIEIIIEYEDLLGNPGSYPIVLS